MAVRRPSNPLALAVLVLLYERPMHPYEMATTLRERAKHESIKLNYGSLYTVVEALQRDGLIEAVETIRDGRRPERTVYDITEAGKVLLVDWLSDLIRTPTKEFTQFEAGLSLIAALPPDDAVRLLKARLVALEVDIRRSEGMRGLGEEMQLPRLFWIEDEYRIVLRRAERDWVKSLVDDIESGRLDGLQTWRGFHADRPPLTALPGGENPLDKPAARPRRRKSS
jgi:DNA-binding PadR family transcriptional regulator